MIARGIHPRRCKLMIIAREFEKNGQVSLVSPDSVSQLRLIDDSPDSKLIWIDMESSTLEEDELVFKKLFPIHRLTLEDISYLRTANNKPHLPKIEEYPGYLFVIMNPLCDDFETGKNPLDIDHATTQLSIFIHSRFLITHHLGKLKCLEEVAAYFERHPLKAHHGTDFLAHMVMDGIIDRYWPLLDSLEERCNQLEEVVFVDPGKSNLQDLIGLKRMINVLRKTLLHEKEIFLRMSRGEFQVIGERRAIYYRDVYDHTVRFVELVENNREMISDLLQAHLSASSNKLNEVMKVLTIISILILPMTVISGIYGMNFENQPEVHWEYGYPMALFLMFCTSFGTYKFFKFARWI
jgi:magnesium transporter